MISCANEPPVGNIYCRLLPDSREIIELGNFFKNAMQGGRNFRFLIQEVSRESFPESAIINSDIVERMIRLGQFSMGRIAVQLSNQLAATTISLCLDDGKSYTISRFPRSLLQDETLQTSSIPFPFCRGLLLTT